MPIGSLVVFALVVVAGFYGIAIFNRLVALRRRCDQAASDIDVQMKQRYDLIPNLVETVKGYAAHERGTLEEVMRARNAAAVAQPGPAQAQSEAVLTGAIGRLMAVAEAYPDLKASANFSALQGELADIENKIAAARRYLNAAVNEYNVSREQFPANLIASRSGFADKQVTVIEPEQRANVSTPPSVRF
jgi:LemA protein